MLPPRHILFTPLEGALLDSSSKSWAPAAGALAEVARRGVPLVLVTAGTRAELEPLRRKIGHALPFITESGGGLFLPDGYFSQRLEGAVRVGRYFCVPFGRSHADAVAAAEEIAAQSQAGVVLYSQMSIREIAGNTGQPLREAELARQREFSERFFFAGSTDVAVRRFSGIAHERGWQVIPDGVFWEIRSGNAETRAVQHLMRLYRSALHTRLSSVGIGSAARDLALLSAMDLPIVLPRRGSESDAGLLSHLSHPSKGEVPGPEGWSRAVLSVLERP